MGLSEAWCLLALSYAAPVRRGGRLLPVAWRVGPRSHVATAPGPMAVLGAPDGAAVPAGAVDLQITSFNVLNPIFNRINNEGVRESTDEGLWMPRHQAIVRQLERSRPDIIALQEYWAGGPDAYRELYERELCLDGGYTAHLCTRPGRGDGCLTLLGPRARVVGPPTVVHFGDFADRVAHLMHVEVAPAAGAGGRGGALERGAAGREGACARFLLVNTHLTYPHAPFFSAIRLDEVRCIMSAIDSLKREQMLPDDTPVVVCGDFNGSPAGHVYKAMVAHGFASAVDQQRGCVQYAPRHLGRLPSSAGPLATAPADARERPLRALDGSAAWVTHRCHTGRCSGVDYVWLSEARSAAWDARLLAARDVHVGRLARALLSHCEQIEQELNGCAPGAACFGGAACPCPPGGTIPLDAFIDVLVHTVFRETASERLLAGGTARTPEQSAREREAYRRLLRERGYAIAGLDGCLLRTAAAGAAEGGAGVRGTAALSPCTCVAYRQYVELFSRWALALTPHAAPRAGARAAWALRATGAELQPSALMAGHWPESYALSDHGMLSVTLRAAPTDAWSPADARPAREPPAAPAETWRGDEAPLQLPASGQRVQLARAPAAMLVPLCLAVGDLVSGSGAHGVARASPPSAGPGARREPGPAAAQGGADGRADQGVRTARPAARPGGGGGDGDGDGDRDAGARVARAGPSEARWRGGVAASGAAQRLRASGAAIQRRAPASRVAHSERAAHNAGADGAPPGAAPPPSAPRADAEPTERDGGARAAARGAFRQRVRLRARRRSSQPGMTAAAGSAFGGGGGGGGGGEAERNGTSGRAASETFPGGRSWEVMMPEAAMMDALDAAGRPLVGDAAYAQDDALANELAKLISLDEIEVRLLQRLPDMSLELTAEERGLYERAIAALDYFGDWADPANTRDSIVLACESPRVIGDEYTCSDGAFTPERAALHERIMAHMLPAGAGRRGFGAPPSASAAHGPGLRRAYIVVGVPGSGKDSVLKKYLRRQHSPVGIELIDASADRLKGYLAQWAEDELCKDVRTHCEQHGYSKQLLHAQYLHRESIYIVRKVVERAVELRLPFMLEKTLYNVPQIVEQVRTLRGAGYEVHVYGTLISPLKNWEFLQKRARSGQSFGRLISKQQAVEALRRYHHNLEVLLRDPDLDAGPGGGLTSINLYDVVAGEWRLRMSVPQGPQGPQGPRGAGGAGEPSGVRVQPGPLREANGSPSGGGASARSGASFGLGAADKPGASPSGGGSSAGPASTQSQMSPIDEGSAGGRGAGSPADGGPAGS